MLLNIGQDAVGHLFYLDGVEGGEVHGDEAAVEPDPRRRPGSQMEVRRIFLNNSA